MDRLLRSFRALVFGLVWAFVLAAAGVRTWSLWWWLSLIPALAIFDFIELLVFTTREIKN